MKVDVDFCSSMFLLYRTLYPYNICFNSKYEPEIFQENENRLAVYNSFELESLLKQKVQEVCNNGKACLALSGGIDSAILAKFMPKGATAYTFRCVVPGVKVTDETARASYYAKECGLKHKIVDIYWDDMEKFAPELMKHKGAPIHSIEVQIAKAALEAKKDGFDTVIFGESADVNFGGHDGLLSKDYYVSEFLERFAFVMPYKVLKKPQIYLDPVLKYSDNGNVDVHEFVRHQYYCESMGSYQNASKYAKMGFSAPYSESFLGTPLDYYAVRHGRSKYFVRDIFERLYPNVEIPKKIPMPRPMDEWLQNWDGPKRGEFIENCQSILTGDQKWMVWALEKFLDLIEDREY